VDAEVSEHGEKLDYNPAGVQAVRRGLPGGGHQQDGELDWVACSTHNYREFMGGFTEWVGTIADSKTARVPVTGDDSENASMWQSLSFKPNYKAAYCLAVCPAARTCSNPTWRTARPS